MLAAVGQSDAGGVDGTLAPLREALAAGRTGTLETRALTDPPMPAGSPTPLPGVNVAILPWTEEVQARLDAIKAGSRDSMQRYLSSIGDVHGVLSAWERDVAAGGGEDFVLRATTDEWGAARFADVPAGDWLLIAWRLGTTKAPRTVKPRRDDANFVAGPATTSHSVVSVWRWKLEVQPGETVEATLTERGVWLSGVHAEARPGAQAPVNPKGQKHR